MSCDDFLTIIPQDQQVLETYYTSEEAINANTASLYNAYIWQDFDMNFMWMAGDELAGDLYYTYSEEGQFYNMAFNNGNQFLTKGWNGLFRVVSYCNNIINGMPAVARSNGISENIVNRGLAEAYCIRGIAYYWLTEYWQDVPIITNNNISGDQVIRNTQASVYEFIRQDLEFAKDHLPITPFQAGRCSYYTATGMLAKLHLTMASHLSDANSANNFTKAKLYAAEVINNSGLKISDTNLATLFYPAGNNGSESLFAIQCITGDYGYGNGHNVSLSRNAFVNLGDAWGAGKGPTLSLQDQFETNDLRRKLTFMRNGDSYNNLGGGGYTYNNFSEDESTETSNEMLAHVRKYVIGANADCDGKAGSNGNAGNNIYLLRLADVYLCYVEACIGAGVSTSDALALDAFNQIRIRAGLTTPVTEISYDQLIKERRVEFALEGINFFDVKRMSYRDMNQGIAYLNDMHRERQYVSNGNFTWQERNANNAYHGGFTSLHPDDDPAKKGSIFYLNKDAATITITEKNLVLPIPAETLTKTPSITQEPVDYSF
jgi:hypothetical protein